MDMNLGTKVKVDDVRWYARGEGLSVSDGGLDREKGVVLDLGIGWIWIYTMWCFVTV